MFGIYAQKGVTIDLNLKTEPIENGAINQTGIGIQLLSTKGEKLTFDNSLTYKNTGITNSIENYLLKEYVPKYETTRFNSFEYVLKFTHQITPKTNYTFSIEPTANFESQFDSSDIMILGGVEINQILNDKSSIAIGAKRMTVFGKPEILPIFSYNYQINQAMSLKMGFPNSSITYSNSNRNTFSLHNDFDGSSYNLNFPIEIENSTEITKVGFSQVETTLKYERNLDSYWYLSLKGGYSFNKEFKFTNDDFKNEINQPLRDGGIFSISLKYKL